jgi:LysM repeat protein
MKLGPKPVAPRICLRLGALILIPLWVTGCNLDPFGAKEEVQAVRTNTDEDLRIVRGDILRLREDVNQLSARLEQVSAAYEQDIASLKTSVNGLERQLLQTNPSILSEVDKRIADSDARRVADKNMLIDKINSVVDQINGLSQQIRAASSRSGSTEKVSQKGFYYTVEDGDTLWGIASKFKSQYGVTVEAIRQANEMGASSDRIVPGQKLFIPVKE